MSIREDSKKVIQHFLEKAIDCGMLDELFPFQYSELAQTLNFKDENYCRICCQYLKGIGYINITSKAKENDRPKISLRASAIDFLETN